MSAVSAWRIEATQLATLVNNCIFGADSATYARWLNVGNYLGLGVKKHALAVLLVAVITEPLVWAGVPDGVAAGLAMAAIWGGVAAIAWLYFRRVGLSRTAALATVTLAISSFGLITHSGIVETYGVTLLVIAIACLLLPAIARTSDSHPVGSATLAGAIGAGLALGNAPSVAFMLVYFACLPLRLEQPEDRRKLALCVAIPSALILFAVIAPVIVAEGTAGAVWHRDYLGRYANAGNFIDAATVGNYVSAVAVFSFVAPLEFIQCRFVASHLVDLVSRPLALAAYVGTVSLVIIGVVRSLRTSRRNEVLGLLAAIASILVFYLYFNPDEALLYSPQWLLPLFFASSPDFRGAAVWAGGAAIIGLAVNLPPLQDPRSFDPEVCCPIPPGSMLPREHPSALEQVRRDAEQS